MRFVLRLTRPSLRPTVGLDTSAAGIRTAFVGVIAALLMASASACEAGAGATGAGAGGRADSGASVSSGGVGGQAATSSSGGVGGGIDITVGSGSGSGSGGAPNCGSELQGVVRDFMVAHPDFEDYLGDDKGIVLPDLGPDKKPVYAGSPSTPTTTGKSYFDQWYNDEPDVNLAIPITITLTPANGVSTYDNSAFFPIDGQGFGDEGNTHNYHFTYEIHTQFEYKGGEVFTFTGDDDLFTFINGKLAINLGGVHGAESQSVDLDAMAPALGIQLGGTYPLDFFFAERHTSESNFRIDTTIGCFSPPPPG